MRICDIVARRSDGCFDVMCGNDIVNVRTDADEKAIETNENRNLKREKGIFNNKRLRRAAFI